ncbi:MAG: hypothetical protein GY716_03015 [bacterium]|nr:hypothetical protein [bacterium]
MKDIEKFLTDLPKPAVDVPAFKDQLRRELRSSVAAPVDPRWRMTAMLSGVAALLMVGVLTLFVARPAIPAGIHASLGGTSPASTQGAAPDSLPAAADRAFVDAWSARQTQPVGVRAMEEERLVSVRQFELTDGKRMLVFTELGNDTVAPAVKRADPSATVF